MKKLFLMLFTTLSLGCMAQNVTMKFNTVSVIENKTMIVKPTQKASNTFVITQTTVKQTSNTSTYTYKILGEPNIEYVDGSEVLKMVCQDSRGIKCVILFIKGTDDKGIYVMREKEMTRYYNTNEYR